jgi:AraC-like DNA-binding protein
MLAWNPILIQQIEIQALGFILRKLQLNRHREAEVALHRHNHAQLILYLSGEGRQTIHRQQRMARAGDLFIIPAGVSHGFALEGHSRPLCLVLDYETKRASGRVVHRRLPQTTLNELHSLLAQVPPKGRLKLADYGAILAVVSRLVEQAPAGVEPVPATTFERVRPLLHSTLSLAKVARSAGYHPDHLNRKLKRETGLGLRALRDKLRLEKAQLALRHASSVAEAGTQAGFDDANYFARWFRQQTGQTPTAWKAR